MIRRIPLRLVFMFILFSSRGRGRIRVISKSKIKNRIEIRKNWVENVIRFGVIGLNPHSNLVILSFWWFWKWAKFEKIRGREKMISMDRIIALIIEIIFLQLINWKLIVLLY
jgi:hypothetical protein